MRLATLLILLAIFGSGYCRAGLWEPKAADGLWSTPTNWQFNAVPTSTDSSFIQYSISNLHGEFPIIDSSVSAVTSDLLLGDLAFPSWGGGEVSLTMTGGTLSLTSNLPATGGNFLLGRVDFVQHLTELNPFTSVGQNHAVFDISGGNVTLDGAMFLGHGSSATVNQSDGLITMTILLMNAFSSGVSDANSQYNLDGGALHITNPSSFGLSFWDNGNVNFDISGSGQLLIDGNWVPDVEDLVSNGILTTYNGLGSVNISYSSAADLITVTATPPTLGDADFDDDGNVDGFDFLTWQRGFGLHGELDKSRGDANGDGSIDDADLSVWETKYGGDLLASAATAVPEPATVFFALFATGWIGIVSRPLRG